MKKIIILGSFLLLLTASVLVTGQIVQAVVDSTMNGDLDGDCNVDLDDLNIVLFYQNQPASICLNCDLDGDKKITVLDARKLVLLCTLPRCLVIEENWCIQPQ